MASVVLRNVVKRFRSTTAVDDLSLEIQDREFAVLVGPSGCGKTTALRMIAGLEPVTSGTIWIGGTCVNDVEPKDRDIAMVFQNYALYPHMDVRENLGFGLKMRGFPRQEIDARVQEAADILGIHDLLGRRPKQLSGGQRQRVAVGRAIVRKPQVFLFDEPLSNLDAKLRVAMRAEISKLHRRLGATIVYVTHDQVEAMTMASRIFIMQAGALQQAGKPMELYRHPASQFVAGFIGSPGMNFLDATLRSEGGALFVERPSLKLRLPGSFTTAAAPYVGRTVLFGVRPEHVTQSHGAGGSGASDRTLSGRADVVETLGYETFVHVACSDRVLVARLATAQHAIEVGQPLVLDVDMERTHLFDAETTRTIV